MPTERERQYEQEMERKNLERLESLERWRILQDSKTEQLFTALAEIKDDTRWIRRTFIAALITGSFSGLIAMIVWLIQRG